MFITVGFLPAEEVAEACEVASSQSQSSAFEAALKDMRQLLAKYGDGLDTCCQIVYRTSDYHYFFINKMDGLHELDSMFRNLGMAAERAGTEWFDLINRFAGTFETETMGTFYIRNDLASNPIGLASAENEIVNMEFYYVKSGQWPAFENVLRSHRVMNSTKSVQGGYDVLSAHMWKDLPLYIIVRYGDGGDNLSHSLSTQAADLCRKMDHKTAKFMKDLSNKISPKIEEKVD
jgi:hypothetical protein